MPWPPLFAVTFKPLFTYWGRSYFCFFVSVCLSCFFLLAVARFVLLFLLFCILLARFLVLFNELPGKYYYIGLCLLSSLLGFIAFARALPFAFASSFWCPFYFPAVL